MDKKKLAYNDWLNGKTYKEISKKYGVHYNTVCSWANKYWKTLDEPIIESKKQEVASKEHKTFNYSKYLTKEEVDVMTNFTAIDTEKLLVEQIAFYSIRELNLLKVIRLQTAKADSDGLIKTSITMTLDDEEAEQMSFVSKDKGNMKIRTESVLRLTKDHESELTRVQKAKTSCIIALDKIRKENEDNLVVDDWVNSFEIGGIYE